MRAEREYLRGAETKLHATLDEVAGRQRTAISSFRSLAAQQDAETTSLIAELAKATLVAALGHLGGAILGAAMSKVHPMFSKAAAEAAATAASLPDAARTIMIAPVRDATAVVQRVVDVSTDATQTIVGDAFSKSQLQDPHAQTREFFAAGMEAEIGGRTAATKRRIATLIEGSEVTAIQLSAMDGLFKAIKEEMFGAYYQHTCSAWASYMAQSRLGTHWRREKDGRKRSEMTDYFGEHQPSGRVFGTSKRGTVGVLAITMRVTAPGSRPRVDHDATRVNGMNSEMTATILASAKHRFDAVWLPKEVHVDTGYGHAVIALDERNQVRDIVDWDSVHAKTGVGDGLRFWQLWGKDIVLQ